MHVGMGCGEQVDRQAGTGSQGHRDCSTCIRMQSVRSTHQGGVSLHHQKVHPSGRCQPASSVRSTHQESGRCQPASSFCFHVLHILRKMMRNGMPSTVI